MSEPEIEECPGCRSRTRRWRDMLWHQEVATWAYCLDPWHDADLATGTVTTPCGAEHDWYDTHFVCEKPLGHDGRHGSGPFVEYTTEWPAAPSPSEERGRMSDETLNPLGGRWVAADGTPTEPTYATEKDRHIASLESQNQALQREVENKAAILNAIEALLDVDDEHTGWDRIVALQGRAEKAEKLLLSISRLDEPNRLEAVGMAAGYFAALIPHPGD